MVSFVYKWPRWLIPTVHGFAGKMAKIPWNNNRAICSYKTLALNSEHLHVTKLGELAFECFI